MGFLKSFSTDRRVPPRNVQLDLERLEQRILLSGTEYLPGLEGPTDILEHTEGQVIYLDLTPSRFLCQLL